MINKMKVRKGNNIINHNNTIQIIKIMGKTTLSKSYASNYPGNAENNINQIIPLKLFMSNDIIHE